MKKFILTLLLVVVSIPSFAQSDLYPLPASWSLRAVASFSQPRIHYGSVLGSRNGSVTSAFSGDLYILATSPNPLLYRFGTSTWELIGGSGQATDSTSISFSESYPVASKTFWFNNSTGIFKVLSTFSDTYSHASQPTFPFGYFGVWNGLASPSTTSIYANNSGTASGVLWITGSYSSGCEKAVDQYPGDYFATSRLVPDGKQSLELYNNQAYTGAAWQEFGPIKYVSLHFDPGYKPSSWKLFIDPLKQGVYPIQVATSGTIPDVDERVFVELPVATTAPAWKITFYGSSECRIRDWALWGQTIATPSHQDYVTVLPPASITVTTPNISPSTATPTSPATGTLWMDGNMTPPKMKAWDGTSWQALW